jgi:NHL repeat
MRRLIPALGLLALVLAAPLSAGPATKPRLLTRPPAQVGAQWSAVVAATRRPTVGARLGRRVLRVTVRRLRPARYRLRVVFPAPGRWTLFAGRNVLGTVVVRAAPARLTNALDVVVDADGSLLVADFSNRVFRIAGRRTMVVAGNGRGGRSGDGGPATRAAIGFPVEVAVDPRGGFGLVHDERWIRHVDRSGTIRTVAEFRQPTALAYDASGNLYVSELLGGVLRRDATTGSTTAYAGFQQPHGLAVAPDGSVYVADTFNNRVRKIAPDGAITTLADGLGQPNDVAVGPDGHIYAAVYTDNAVVRITPTGSVTTVARSVGPSSVAVAPDGTVYVTERDSAIVRQIRP